MRKLLAAITVIACIFFASSALAAGVKVPKSFCLDVIDNFIELNFITKASGSMTTSGNQKVMFYDVQGNLSEYGIRSAPLDGSGYLDGNIFHFHFAGVVYTALAVNFSADVYFDVVLGTGYMYFTQLLPGGTPTQHNWTLQTQPCGGITIPFDKLAPESKNVSSMLGN